MQFKPPSCLAITLCLLHHHVVFLIRICGKFRYCKICMLSTPQSRWMSRAAWWALPQSQTWQSPCRSSADESCSPATSCCATFGHVCPSPHSPARTKPGGWTVPCRLNMTGAHTFTPGYPPKQLRPSRSQTRIWGTKAGFAQPKQYGQDPPEADNDC